MKLFRQISKFMVFAVALLAFNFALAGNQNLAFAEGGKCAICGKTECGEKCPCSEHKNCGHCNGVTA